MKRTEVEQNGVGTGAPVRTSMLVLTKSCIYIGVVFNTLIKS
ncbi:MAG: hypothetical protein V1752_06975 [Candidatus Firestonebacteria bacterium]